MLKSTLVPFVRDVNSQIHNHYCLNCQLPPFVDSSFIAIKNDASQTGTGQSLHNSLQDLDNKLCQY